MSRHLKNIASVPSSLSTCDFVFVRCDAYRPFLVSPCDGSFCLLKGGEKFFILDINGRMDSVSVNRQKPAHMGRKDELLVTLPRKRGRPKKVETNRFVYAFLGELRGSCYL